MSGCARRSLLLATAICLSWSGCRQDKENDVPPVSMDMAPMDKPPDSESMSALRNEVTATVEAIRNGHLKHLYDLFAPEIQRAVPFFVFRQKLIGGHKQTLSLPKNLPEPDFSRVRDRVATVFITDPDDRTANAVQLYLLRIDARWLLRSIVVYRPPHAYSFDYSGGLISPGSTQQDLIGIKETMLRKALVTGRDWPDEDGFPHVTSLTPSSPVFVETDLDLRAGSQISIPGWTIQVVSESAARARGNGNRYFAFGLVQIFGDLALGELSLGHRDLLEGSGGAIMWLVRTGSIWRFYKYEGQEIS